MKKLTTISSASALAIALAAPVLAQEAAPEPQVRQGGNAVIVVTATKRSADLQDVPVSVQALGGEALEELGVANFRDYLVELPNVTAGGSGPGQSTIYIRGLASTTPNLTTAGVAGLAPNVAL
ncbi:MULTISPECIES: TonB-dependent receptor plug domain-containing protein [Pacificimonas]|uniref:TonB-dependent receptor plug domain-containing protein n=1 Tax=Pacificimonas TaxID=1960290 RepID=UPI001CCE446A|nr:MULTISPECIES: TonB-dependent receptor plug domain-containing protein [Pacificimonas]